MKNCCAMETNMGSWVIMVKIATRNIQKGHFFDRDCVPSTSTNQDPYKKQEEMTKEMC